ncbi:MAG: cell wall-binding repeat-containing protein [Candidatus Nanohaloarchaea archaeon]
MAVVSFSAAQESPSNDDSNVDKVILASTANFPDAFIASAPSEKLGIPVLLTDKNQLTSSTRQSIQELGAEEVIIVGGPAVVSDSVQTEVESMVNSTTRLFGTTQVGTSIEVSSYFWGEGSDSATIVQYPQDAENGYKLLSAVKNEVQDEDEPILISKTGTLSAAVLSEIDRLGATEVDVYSTDAVNVTQDLRNIGVTDVEVEEPEQESENETEEIESLSDQVQSRVAQSSRNRSTLVIVAAANFRHAISVPVAPNSASFVVGSQEQVSDAVELVRDTEAESIKVTGKPEFARQIADRIESETNRSVDRVSGPPEQVTSSITADNRREWNRLQQKRFGRWRQQVMNSEELQRQANRTLRKAEAAVDSNSSGEAQEHLIEAQEAFEEGDYFEARKSAIRALSIVNSERYQRMTHEEVREEIEDEREDTQEAVRKMKEFSREMAQELREAESQEERLEIIQEFRDERRELRKEAREEARERRKDGDRAEVGSSEVKLELEGSELKAETEYTAPSLGYTWSKKMNRGSGSVKFTFSLSPPTGAAGQAVTDYKAEKSVKLEDGSYSASVTLVVDGQQVNSLSRDVSVPGFTEHESETGKSENESAEDGSETEDETSSPDNVVTYTDSGFQPQTITIQRGEEVTWVNEAGSSMWVASDRHPTHTQYDGTSTSQHCSDGESDTFDQCSSGGRFSFEFEKTGEFGYHNHRAAGDTGTVIVR